MNDIFQEVDEALKQEKAEKFWHDHKDKIIMIIIGFIALVGVFTFYQNWDRNRDGEATAILYNVVESKEYNTLDDARKTVQSVGYLIAGGEALDSNKEQAVTYFTQASNKTSKRDIKDLASLYSVNFENEATAKTITPITADNKSAWQYHAALQKSALLAEENKFEDAINTLDIIVSAEIVAPTLKQRAQAMQHIYTIQNNNKAESNKNAE